MLLKIWFRSYQTSEGTKVKEFGPFIYGYSMKVRPDGKPTVREFGNVKSPFRERRSGIGKGMFGLYQAINIVRKRTFSRHLYY